MNLLNVASNFDLFFQLHYINYIARDTPYHIFFPCLLAGLLLARLRMGSSGFDMFWGGYILGE